MNPEKPDEQLRLHRILPGGWPVPSEELAGSCLIT
jgi:hypothetical protein